jgi:SIR2-like domain
MEYDEVLNRLNDQGTSGLYMRRTFLISLLRTHLESQGKSFSQESRQNTIPFDAYAPDGFDQFDGPTYIEITAVVSLDKLMWKIDSFNKYRESKTNDQLLIISTRPFSRTVLLQAINYIMNLNIPVTIWEPKDISDIAQKHPDDVRELGSKLFKLRLETAFNKEQENWEEERKVIIENVKKSYDGGQFTLFLGAGVSSSAGLPDWDTLLNSLFVSLLTSEFDQNKKTDNGEVSSIVKRLREVDGPSALMSARYIRKGMSNSSSQEQTEFINTVTKQLYGLRNKRRSIDSPLIRSISAMCMPGRTGAKVKSVVTYNFDDFIERELLKKEIVHKSIFEEMEIPTPEELPVYHVHGYLPEDRSCYSNLDRSTLVFSEEGYHKIYNESYHWSNLVQLNNLRETTCVMIGLSMTDPNLRRLLEIAALSLEKPKHYAFMKRIDIDSFSKVDSKKIVNASLTKIKIFLDRHHTLNEEVLKELGVKIIWFKDYDEIPKILNSVTNATNNKSYDTHPSRDLDL